MTPEELLSIMDRTAELKKNTRHCTIEPGRQESVADHSWRVALMAMLISSEEEFADLDMNRVIRMCLIHDLGEAFTGDIPTFEKTEDDAEVEAKLLYQWIDGFPEKTRREWKELLTEMDALETKEAKTYKALDKLEAIISHNESDISTWLPLEYDLQFNYGKENVKDSPYLKALHDAIDRVTEEKIDKSK